MAQCDLITPTEATIDCLLPYEVEASGFSGSSTLQMTAFNTGMLDASWSSTGVTVFNNPCGPSLDGTPSVWFAESPTPRILTTNAMSVPCGAQVCFDFDFAGDDPCGGCSDCEDPDQLNEGVFLQYSTDNGITWVDIFYFEPNSNNIGSYYQWNNYCFNLPQVASTSSTMIRWNQAAITNNFNDHWGVDNVEITSTDCNFWYDWAHIPGFPDNPIQSFSPSDTTTYFVTYTDGAVSCTDSITLNVLPLEIDILSSANPIDCWDCLDLSVEFLNLENGTLSDDFNSGINQLLWSNIQSATTQTICGGGATGNALYFNGTWPQRYAETAGINIISCGEISFCLYMGNTGSTGSSCDNCESGEDVVLEYSVDGGATFVPIATYSQSLWDGADYQQCFSELMPPAAQSTWAIFRWRQIAFSTTGGTDNWSLDDVEIEVTCDPTAVNYSWTGLVNDPTSSTPEACPLADELYSVSIVNPVNGCTASDTMTLFVNQCDCAIIEFDGIAITQPGGVVDVNGTFQYLFSPTTGTVEVEATNATGTYSQTFNLPFTDSLVYNYSIAGIPNDGSTITLDVYFSDSLSCNQTFDIVNPPISCFFVQFDGTLDYQFNGSIVVSGVYEYSSSPTMGTLEIEATNATGTYTETINPPFTDSVAAFYTIIGIPNDGSTITLDIYFSDSLNCTETFDLTPTASLEVIEGQENICVLAPNPVVDESKLIFANEKQEEITISITNERGQSVFETTTIDSSIPIKANRFRQGIYFYVVKSDGSMEGCGGKFAVIMK